MDLGINYCSTPNAEKNVRRVKFPYFFDKKKKRSVIWKISRRGPCCRLTLLEKLGFDLDCWTPFTMQKTHKSMLQHVISEMRAASKEFKVSIDTGIGNIGTAFAAQAIIANAQIRSTESLEKSALKNGVELMFVYVSIPRGATVSAQKIPTGFYVIKVYVDIVSLEGKAEFLNAARRTIFSLPLQVEYGTLHSVSGGFSRCHVSADVGFKVGRQPVLLTVNLKWC